MSQQPTYHEQQVQYVPPLAPSYRPPQPEYLAGNGRPQPSRRPQRGVGRFLIPIGTFILGLFVGAIIMAAAVGSSTTSESTPAGTPASASVPVATASTPAAPAPVVAATTAVQLDREGRWACQDFAGGVRQAVTPAQRGDLAAKILKWAPESQTPGIATGAAALGRAWRTDAGWQLAADTFAAACLTAGFKG